MMLEGYKTNAGNICITGCLRDMFNYLNYDMRENMIFAVSGANMFYYKPFNLDNMDKFRLGGIYYDVLELIENTLKFFDIEIIRNESNEPDELLKFIKDNINKNKPVLAITSRKYLDYMPKQFQDDITHCINIIGYNDDNTFTVSDTYIPTKPVAVYEGILSEESLLKSIKYSRDIFKDRFSYNLITVGSYKEIKFKDLPYDKLIQPIKTAADIYINSETTKQNILVGERALKQFHDDLMRWLDEKDIKMLKDILKKIHNNLVDFGGCVTTYQFLSEYMTFLHQKTNNELIIKIGDDLQYLSKRWFILANTICKSAFIMQEDTKCNIDNRLTEIICLEKALWDKIKVYFN